MKKIITLILISILFFISCKNKTTIKEKNNLISKTDIEGIYVSDKYKDRLADFDWVAVIIKQIDKKNIAVSVRSRTDKKKATCEFDVKAVKETNTTYEAIMNDISVLFTISNDKVLIKARDPEKALYLGYFCSGGGNFVGEYSKITEPLDKSQMK